MGNTKHGLSVGVFALIGGTDTVVANTTTSIPGGGGHFSAFGFLPTIDGSKVAFGANGGIYRYESGTIQKIASSSTPIPNGTGFFSGFSDPVIQGDRIVFRGQGTGSQTGVYLEDGNAPLQRIADTNTLVPGAGAGVTFTGLGDPAMDNGMVGFYGDYGAGQNGVFLYWADGSLLKVLARGDVLDGKTVVATHLDPGGMGDGHMAFRVDLSDQTTAVYLVSLPEPAGVGLMATACLLLVRARRSRARNRGLPGRT